MGEGYLETGRGMYGRVLYWIYPSRTIYFSTSLLILSFLYQSVIIIYIVFAMQIPEDEPPEQVR